MHKEVMKPRSFRLENLSMLAAVLALATWLCAGCGIEEPFVGKWYQCSGQLVCDGQKFGITGKTCSDAESVEGDYVEFSTAWAEHQGVKCGAIDVVDVECVATVDACGH